MSVISLCSNGRRPITLLIQLLLCSSVTMTIHAEKTEESSSPQSQNVDISKPNKTGLSPVDNPSSTSVSDPQDADDVIWHDVGDPRRLSEQYSWSPDLLTSDDSYPEAYTTWREEPGGYPVEEDAAATSSGYDKRFMRGFQKRFMRGFQKRFMRGFQKRFMRGFRSSSPSDFSYPGMSPDLVYSYDPEAWYGKNDKRFMRGFTKRSVPSFEPASGDIGRSGLQSADAAPLDKRFMRGFTKKDAQEDPKEEEGNAQVNDTEPQKDKRFMRGFNSFDKRENELTDDEINSGPDKRFMRGLVKKEDDKRFMRGLVKKEDDKRFMRGLVKKEDDKRFMRGFVKKEDDKRFMRGLVKKEDDKRFMRGLVKKEDDKRFMRGLVKKEDDKRFMRGLVKKEDDKRFMRGLVKKDDGLFEDKRFMRGFAKKDDNELLGEKRFMRGFVKKDEESAVEDKRFMRGFTKKDDQSEDKRFMRGLIKKDYDGAEEKRFMRGFTKKDDESEEKRFMRGFTKKDLDKRFMRGLIKKAAEQEDKRFMRGLVKRDAEAELAEGKHREKRQTRFNDQTRNPLLEKLEQEYSDEESDGDDDDENEERWMDYPALPGKRFMRGFESYTKRGGWTDHSLRPLYDGERLSGVSKRFMRGFHVYDDDTKKRFLWNRPTRPSWYDEFYDADTDDSSGLPDKRFIKGLDLYFRPQAGKRFMRGLEAVDKRFIRGLEYYSPRLPSGGRPGLHKKKFTRGLDTVKRAWPEEGLESDGPFLSQSYNRHSQTDFK